MPEIVQEYVSSKGQNIRFDPVNGVIRGVKLLGLQSRNGRSYLEQALRQAVTLYEGSKVNVNHPQGDPLAARDYRDRLGVIRNVQLKPQEGLFGDLHYNPKHALAEQLAWDAEHSPENVGLSHNVLAQTIRSGKQLIVEAITKVQSVDLVADPATTRGLYEHTSPDVLDNGTEAISKAFAMQKHTEEKEKLPLGEGQIILQLEAQLEQERFHNAEISSKIERYQIKEKAIDLLTERRQTNLITLAELNQFLSDKFLQTLCSLEEQEVALAISDRIDLMKLTESNAKHLAPQSIEKSLQSTPSINVQEETTESFVAAITRL